MNAALVEVALADQVVVAQMVAVVAGEDDDRVFGQSLLIQRLQNLADLVVDLLDLRRVVQANLAFVAPR